MGKKTYLEQVKEFHKTFQPNTVVDKIVDLNLERRKLRINLLFEELEELAKASAVDKHFFELLENKYLSLKEKNKFSNLFISDAEEYLIDYKGVIDAFCDLQYVLSGAILEFGMDNIFDSAFEEVHRSNMSKAHNTKEEAELTQEYRLKNYNEETFIEEHAGKFIVKRKNDSKIMKNKNYSAPNLEVFIK